MGVHSEAKEKWDGYGMPQPVVTSEAIDKSDWIRKFHYHYYFMLLLFYSSNT